jgi:NAD(P)H-flavin reductase
MKVYSDEANGNVVRLDFQHNHQPWKLGQHFYLCFLECSIWQSHPFTQSTLPGVEKNAQPHTYIMRAKKGETKKLAELAKSKVGLASIEKDVQNGTTPVILSGPYGLSMVGPLRNGADVNVLCAAGGSGITFVLPVLQFLPRQPRMARSDRKIELIWAVRRTSDLRWVPDGLDLLRAASRAQHIKIWIFVTREGEVTMSKQGVTESLAKQPKGMFVNVDED